MSTWQVDDDYNDDDDNDDNNDNFTVGGYRFAVGGLRSV